jgi:ParB-like chromosome segregation protein Spo0J
MAFGDRPMMLALDEIDVGVRRPVDHDAVSRLAKSIKDIGLQYPISVLANAGRFRLVAGRHRLEAFRALNEETIPANVVKMDDRDARMWEIAENLHRAELTVAQRAEQIAEYARLAKEKRDADMVLRQLGAKPSGRPEGGNRLAARDLGVTEHRAQAIASLPDETKNAARERGLDYNSSALLAPGRFKTTAAQVGVLDGIAERGRVAATPAARPMRDLTNIAAGELARWIKITTPNDRPHVIRVLEEAAAILRDELEGRTAA